MQRKRARGHALAGRGRPQDWSGRRKKSEYARCTLAGEDDGTELMFPREGWSEDRKKASHSPVGKCRGRDCSGQVKGCSFNSTRLRTQEKREPGRGSSGLSKWNSLIGESRGREWSRHERK